MTQSVLENYIVDVPDYPEPGVVFKDITPLLASPEGFSDVVNQISEHYANLGVTKIIGAEARGFLIGAPVAYKMHAGFVPARKPDKLPREVLSESYSLEYGTDELQIHKDALAPGDKVLIVDDLVATGGTAVACAKLAERAGAEVVGFAFAMELTFLKPRDIIAKDCPQEVFTLIEID